MKQFLVLTLNRDNDSHGRYTRAAVYVTDDLCVAKQAADAFEALGWAGFDGGYPDEAEVLVLDEIPDAQELLNECWEYIAERLDDEDYSRELHYQSLGR